MFSCRGRPIPFRHMMNLTWLEFLVGCLATFRMALLVSKEDGPADAVQKVRSAVPRGWIRRGFSCEWCQSFWWGMATAFFFVATQRILWIDFVLFWLAFSAAAVVLNQVFTKD